MDSTTRWWVAVPLVAGLVVAGCGGDDNGSDSDGNDADVASAVPTSTTAAAPEATTSDGGGATDDDEAAGASVGMVTLGEEEIAMASFRCFFEEQPRAGLGGVFTHSAQGQGTNADGEPVVLDMTRARGEDGTVEDDLSVDIGDPRGDDFVSLSASGPEGTIDFSDTGAAASDLEVTDFETTEELTFDLPCS